MTKPYLCNFDQFLESSESLIDFLIDDVTLFESRESDQVIYIYVCMVRFFEL